MPFDVKKARPGHKRAREMEGVSPERVPKVRDLTYTGLIRPSHEVLQRLGRTSLVIGVDIETADWVKIKSKLHTGAFGHDCLCSPSNAFDRIVQIAWAIGDARENDKLTVKEYIVRPDGFKIATKATQVHKITNEKACVEGAPLRDVLDEFMRDVKHVHDRGGRMAIHHLEFDASIIAQELVNAGLGHWKECWARIARNGFCTMDPKVTGWVQECKGKVVEAGQDKEDVVNLETMSRLLLPKGDARLSLLSRLHSADVDAQLHYHVYKEMCAWVDKVVPWET